MIDLKEIIQERNEKTDKIVFSENIKNRISISRIKENIQEPFDKVAVAEKCRARDMYKPSGVYYNKSTEDIIKMWDDKSEYGKTIGCILDKYMENKLVIKSENVRKLILMDHPQFESMAEAIDNFLESISKRGFSFMCREIPLKMIYHYDGEKYLVTARPDAFFSYKDFIVVFDWKSDDKITMDNKFSKLSAPLNTFEDCKWNVYSLQIKAYEYILENVYKIPVEYPVMPYICNFPKIKTGYPFKIIKPNPEMKITENIFNSLIERTILKLKADKDINKALSNN